MSEKTGLCSTHATFSGLQLKRGRILYMDSAGQALIQNEEDQTATLCEFLRITGGSAPSFSIGDRVVYATEQGSERGSERGYMLGILETNLEREDVPNKLRLEALESIELRCGASTFIMTKDGRVHLRGSDVTSRASRINKIKGAAVKIN